MGAIPNPCQAAPAQRPSCLELPFLSLGRWDRAGRRCWGARLPSLPLLCITRQQPEVTVPTTLSLCNRLPAVTHPPWFQPPAPRPPPRSQEQRGPIGPAGRYPQRDVHLAVSLGCQRLPSATLLGDGLLAVFYLQLEARGQRAKAKESPSQIESRSCPN